MLKFVMSKFDLLYVIKFDTHLKLKIFYIQIIIYLKLLLNSKIVHEIFYFIKLHEHEYINFIGNKIVLINNKFTH